MLVTAEHQLSDLEAVAVETLVLAEAEMVEIVQDLLEVMVSTLAVATVVVAVQE
jgi:hypothetical protein